VQRPDRHLAGQAQRVGTGILDKSRMDSEWC
jgi:hypothetical protein